MKRERRRKRGRRRHRREPRRRRRRREGKEREEEEEASGKEYEAGAWEEQGKEEENTGAEGGKAEETNVDEGKEAKDKEEGVGASHSEYFVQEEGLPQGSVPSVTRFAIAINEITKQLGVRGARHSICGRLYHFCLSSHHNPFNQDYSNYHPNSAGSLVIVVSFVLSATPQTGGNGQGI